MLPDGSILVQFSNLPTCLHYGSQLWHACYMSFEIEQTVAEDAERRQFLDSYTENLCILLEHVDAIASELAQVGDYQATMFFTDISRAITAFAAGHHR